MAMRNRLGFFTGKLLAVTLLLGAGPALAAQPTEQQVRQLMDAIGLGKSLTQMNTQIAVSMKQALPCVSSTYWQGYIDENSSKEFIGRLVPVYQKHFSADEIDGMVKFYSSPLGQKVLTEMPAAMAEANQAGQQWSAEHRQQMLGKLEQAGTLDSDGRCPATASAGVAAPADVTAPSDDESDGAAETAAVPSSIHAKASARHGRAPAKKHTGTKKKAVPAKKSASKSFAPAKKGAPAKPAAKHHTATKKPASGSHKAAPAKQGN
jgi:hypothetical protein